MKKSLLITTGLLTLGVVTGIYAQTTGATGTIIDKMKAVAHGFTLSASLNPTDTGLSSDPIKGKKTGDILTAGEYNRILELISEGGGGSGSGWVDVLLTDTADFDVSCSYRLLTTGGIPETYAGINYWVYPITIGSKNIVINSDSGSFGHIYSGSKSIYRVNGSQALTVQKMQKLCGGGSTSSGSTEIVPGWPAGILCESGNTKAALYFNGISAVNFPETRVTYTAFADAGSHTMLQFNYQTGAFLSSNAITDAYNSAMQNCLNKNIKDLKWISGVKVNSGSGWVDVPLTDTADFDVDCEYRVKMDAVGNLPGGNKDDWIYNPTRIGKKVINWENSIVIQSASKNVLWWQWSSNDTYANVTAAWGRHITKIEKRCN